MTRVVVDVNVIVSAMLSENSVPRAAFNRALNQGTVLFSDALLEESRRVLARGRFDRYVTLEERAEFFEGLINDAEFVEISETVQVCRDPKDDRILELAVNGDADYIVTGDTDLLVLNPFRGIEILQPADFLELPL